MSMDFRYLHAFIVVSEKGSLTLAGQKLAISVSAVSRQISLFEKSLGKELFIRGKKGVFLTSEGQALYNIVKQWQHSADAFSGNNKISLLKIGTMQSTFNSMILPIIREFPEHEITLVVGTPLSLKEKLLNKEVDLILTNEKIEESLVTSIRMHSEELIIVSYSPFNEKNLSEKKWTIFTPLEKYWPKKQKSNVQTTRVNSLTGAWLLLKEFGGISILPHSSIPMNEKIFKKHLSAKEQIYCSMLSYEKVPEHLKEIFSLLRGLAK